MTTAQALLEKLQNTGARIWLAADGNKLRINAPKNTISPEMRVSLRLLKAEIVQLLKTKNIFIFRYEFAEFAEFNERSSTTRLFETKPLHPDRLRAFQTPWTGTCFVCNQQIPNYYENCPHCGDFPAWF